MYLKSFSRGGSATKAWQNFLWAKDWRYRQNCTAKKVGKKLSIFESRIRRKRSIPSDRAWNSEQNSILQQVSYSSTRRYTAILSSKYCQFDYDLDKIWRQSSGFYRGTKNCLHTFETDFSTFENLGKSIMSAISNSRVYPSSWKLWFLKYSSMPNFHYYMFYSIWCLNGSQGGGT